MKEQRSSDIKIVKDKKIIFRCLSIIGLMLVGVCFFYSYSIYAIDLEKEKDILNGKIKKIQSISSEELKEFVNSSILNSSKFKEDNEYSGTEENEENLEVALGNDKKNKTISLKSVPNNKKKIAFKTKTTKGKNLQYSGLDKKDKSTTVSNQKRTFKNISEEISYIKLSRLKRLMSDEEAWNYLEKLMKKNPNVVDKSEILQLQATILYKNRYYILSSLYASESISSLGKYDFTKLKLSWEILHKVSSARSIQEIMQSLAIKIIDNKLEAKNLKNKKDQGFDLNLVPPFLDKGWYYYLGSAFYYKKDLKEALSYFSKLNPEDKMFIPAKYESGIIYLINQDNAKAEESFKGILNLKAQRYTQLPTKSLNLINNYTKLALARIMYQNKRFKDSIKFYKSVDKESVLFYEANYEQAWPFFMLGYANHALGSIYGAESPFFNDHFNPETSILKALILYWMCRYDDSKNALADFLERNETHAKSLTNFLKGSKISPEKGYELFENTLVGVSESSLGISRVVVLTAMNKDSVILLRNQYADLLEEARRMQDKGLYGSTRQYDLLDKMLVHFRKKIGNTLVKELENLKLSFDDLYKQAQFLYIELLMSERSHILGKELHSGKLEQTKNKEMFSDKTAQSWKSNVKDEYWWDEVGYYKYNLTSQCNKSIKN